MNWIRRHAATLIWIALIAFVLTLIAGALSDRFFGPEVQQNPQHPELAIAWVGDMPVNAEKFQENLLSMVNRFQQQYPQSSIPPDWYEMMQYNALQDAVQYTVLLNAAKKAKVRVTGAQVQSALESIYTQYHLKDKDALKAFLKKNQYPYDKFEDQLRDDLMVQTFLQNLQSSVTVTDRDLANKYTQVNVAHILIRSQTPTETPKVVHARANEVYQKILGGMPFETAALRYSGDPGSKAKKGHLGWVKYGELVREFEDVAFSLQKGELSRPVNSPFGTHIIRIVDRKVLPRPLTMDSAKEKEALLNFKKQREVQQFLATALQQATLNVVSPPLKAFQSKQQGDVATAIQSYRVMESAQPSSPLPHYLAGKTYLMTGQPALAHTEFKKAAVKGELNPRSDSPYVHLELARLATQNRVYTSEMSKAIMLASKDRVALEQLKSVTDQIGNVQWQGQVRRYLAQLSAMMPTKSIGEALAKSAP